LADFAKAIELNSQLIGVYLSRGDLYRHRGEYDDALADYNKVIELAPDYPEAYYYRGLLHDAKGEYDLALDDFTKAIEVNPHYYYISGVYCRRANLYYKIGEYDRAMDDYGKFDLAVTEYTGAIELDPKDAFAYASRAICWLAKGDYDKAWEDVNHCQQQNHTLDPDVVVQLRRASRTVR